MDIFLKAAVGGLITSVICLTMAKQGKDISVALGICVCCMILAAAMEYLRPVVDFVTRLQALGSLNSQTVEILLKCVGIGFLAEIAGLICTDAGNASLGKTLQIFASVLILWLALPLLDSLLELVESVLGAV